MPTVLTAARAPLLDSIHPCFPAAAGKLLLGIFPMIFSKLDTPEDFGMAGCPRGLQHLPGLLAVTYLDSFWMLLSWCHWLLCLCGSFPARIIPPL